MLDVGGTNVKCMASGQEGLVKIPTGPRFTPARLVREVRKATQKWDYDVITIGFPGIVANGRPAAEPANLGRGWTKFGFRKAFGKPVQIINDAAMQALANYQAGRLLFMGFGTSIGSAIVVDDAVIPLEIARLHLPSGRMLAEKLEDDQFLKHGRKKWMRSAIAAIEMLRDVFQPDDIVLGGGNSKHIEPLPEACRVSENQNAFRGATRLWPGADMLAHSHGTTWRIERAEKKARGRSK
jgi:polyphosphate glucokinase